MPKLLPSNEASSILDCSWGISSFEGTNPGGTRRYPWFLFRLRVQKIRGRSEEQIPGDGTAEVQKAVVVAGRPANEHVLDHLLDRAGQRL